HAVERLAARRALSLSALVRGLCCRAFAGWGAENRRSRFIKKLTACVRKRGIRAATARSSLLAGPPGGPGRGGGLFSSKSDSALPRRIHRPCGAAVTSALALSAQRRTQGRRSLARSPGQADMNNGLPAGFGPQPQRPLSCWLSC